MNHHVKSGLCALVSLIIPVLMLGGCSDSAKPIPVKVSKAPPPYAGHGIDAVGVGRDPNHHSPFGSTSTIAK